MLFPAIVHIIVRDYSHLDSVVSNSVPLEGCFCAHRVVVVDADTGNAHMEWGGRGGMHFITFKQAAVGQDRCSC